MANVRRLYTFFFCLPLAAQHGLYLKDSNNAAIGNPEAIARGAKMYLNSCAGCHGPDAGGGGRGPNLVRRAVWHPLGDQDIFNAIRKGVPGTDMPATQLSDDETWDLVAFIHSITGPASENKVPGDPEAGAKVFWGAKAGCSGCHSIRGTGGKMGPDLTNIGGTHPLAVIKESIVDPSKDLYMLGNEGVKLTLRNGTVLEGIARNRSNYSIQMMDKTGTLRIIDMADVKAMEILEGSPMPGDYAKRLTVQELRDLIAYLSRQTVRGPSTAEPSKKGSL